MPDTTMNDQMEQEPVEQEPQAQDVPEKTPAQEQTAQEEQDGEAKLQAQVADLNDRLLRTMAEYDNFRKRSQREKESIYPQATAVRAGCRHDRAGARGAVRRRGV